MRVYYQWLVWKLSYLLVNLHVHPSTVMCAESLMLFWNTRFAIRTDGAEWINFFCILLLLLLIELRKAELKGPTTGSFIFSYMGDLYLYFGNNRDLLVSVYSTVIGMSLGLDKCAILHLNRRRVLGECKNVELVDENINHLDIQESYKLLSIQQRGVQDASIVKKKIGGFSTWRIMRGAQMT